MQRESGKWYFHKQGNSYKSGTYRGLDLAFGKGKKAAGGILMRSLIPTTVTTGEAGQLIARNSEFKADFIEGPCNCVKKILDVTKPEGASEDFNIIDLVGHKDFNIEAFDQNSCMYLVSGSKN